MREPSITHANNRPTDRKTNESKRIHSPVPQNVERRDEHRSETRERTRKKIERKERQSWTRIENQNARRKEQTDEGERGTRNGEQ